MLLHIRSLAGYTIDMLESSFWKRQLANAAQTFGDFGQHTDGANVDSGVAFAALTVCLELAAALERELPKK